MAAGRKKGDALGRRLGHGASWSDYFCDLVHMNAILTTIASILAVTGVVWVMRWRLHAPLCPICLGVGGTWLWMVVARESGYAIDTTMLPILLGGSVVGIAYLVEKRLPPGRSALLWKTLFIPFGFVAAHALATPHWVLLAVMVLTLALLTAFFLHSPAASTQANDMVGELKEKMKNCC
ncbi:MAG: hypothetical protein JJD98_05700 [Polaromonas sp.]|nr:hypothetical protein [Polaromonas sp.]